MSKKKSATNNNRSGGLNNNFQQKIETNKRFIKFLNERQKEAWDAYNNNSILFLTGAAGSGKAQPLNAILYTKNGPIKMGDVKIGDEIANPDGNFTKVINIFPQGTKQIYRVHFSDYTYVDCCEDHLWQVSNADNRICDKIRDTKTIALKCKRNNDPNEKRLWSINCTKPINFNRREFLINPYVMGILISEGCLRAKYPMFSSSEKEIVEKVASFVDEGYTVKSKRRYYENSTATSIDHRITKTKRNPFKNKYTLELTKLGIWNKMAYEKFIPQEYLFSSIDQRISLLQGLMDGDGTVDKQSGQPSYTTTSYKLAQDFCQLIYSLGGSTRIREKKGTKKIDGTRHRKSYTMVVNLPNDIQVFFLQRKEKLRKARTKYTPKRYIDRIEKLDKFTEMQCISVDNPNHLYLTNNFTITHNTFLSSSFAVNDILNRTKEIIYITRPLVEAGESMGFLPGDVSEKVAPFLTPIYDCIGKICGPKDVGVRSLLEKKIEVAPLALLRGRTFSDAVCILDEAQNCTKGQLKLFLTRIGENCKMIITGDLTQSDLFEDPDLRRVLESLQGIKGIAHVHFDDCHIVRNPLIAEIIKRI